MSRQVFEKIFPHHAIESGRDDDIEVVFVISILYYSIPPLFFVNPVSDARESYRLRGAKAGNARFKIVSLPTVYEHWFFLDVFGGGR